jgi:hypothetical protein
MTIALADIQKAANANSGISHLTNDKKEASP